MPDGRDKLSDIIAEIWDRSNRMFAPERSRKLLYWQYTTEQFRLEEIGFTMSEAPSLTYEFEGTANPGTWGEATWS